MFPSLRKKWTQDLFLPSESQSDLKEPVTQRTISLSHRLTTSQECFFVRCDQIFKKQWSLTMNPFTELNKSEIKSEASSLTTPLYYSGRGCHCTILPTYKETIKVLLLRDFSTDNSESFGVFSDSYRYEFLNDYSPYTIFSFIIHGFILLINIY